MNKQQLIVLDINSTTQQLIQDKLDEGFFIFSITNLNPTLDKLLILYSIPEVSAP